ncbi:MAG: hypothetical protein PHI90_06335 [Clostridia bacterium]|nr:hypothetical protein [Clostridia bacterium]MDD4048428.1 hypothetical protein [Clostridia bacterium]
MKRARFLLATLVCAVMVMGVGYAWWTDSISVTETAETGELDVKFVTEDVYPNTAGTSDYVVPGTVTTDAEGKTVTCSFTNLYPGAEARIDLKAKNIGTIPVKLKNATISFDAGSSEALKSSIDAYVLYYKLNVDGSIASGSVGSTTVAALDKLAAKIISDPLLMGLQFAPNESLCLGGDECIVLKVKDDAGDGIENETLTFTLQLEWKQFNEI